MTASRGRSDLLRTLLAPWNASASVRSVSWLAVGALLAQVLQALALPVLARVFDPDALGVWALIQTGVLFAASVAGLRYELALPLLRDDRDASAVARLQITCVVIGAALTGLLVASGIVVPDEIEQQVDSKLLVAGAVLLVLGGASFQLLTQACTRDGAFSQLAGLRLVNGPGQTISQVMLGLMTSGRPSALLAGAVIGTVVSVLAGAGRLRGYFVSGEREEGRMRRNAVHFRRFPFFVAPYGLVTLARDRGLFVLLAAFADLATVGAVAMAQRLVSLPVGLVSSAVSPVLHRRLSQAEARSELEPSVARLFVVMIWGGAAMFGGLAATSGWVVPWVLGPEWGLATTACAALALWGLTLFLSAVFDRTFDIVQRQARALWIEGSNSIVSIFVLWGMLAAGRPVWEALLAFAVSQASHHVVWVASAWRAIGFTSRGLSRIGVHALAAILIAAALAAIGITLWRP